MKKICLLIMFSFVLLLFGCTNNPKENLEKDKTPYEIALENGFEGTYEEWLALNNGTNDETNIGTNDDTNNSEKPKEEVSNIIAKSYVNSSLEERMEILSLLEKYAYDNSLSGISLFESCDYYMFNEAVKLKYDNPIPGYDYNVIKDGEILSDLKSENNPLWKRYYHTYETYDPATLNLGITKLDVSRLLSSYVSGTYYDTKVNDTKDGYEWYNNIAKSEPIIVDEITSNGNKTGLSYKYKVEVKCGDELVYTTLSNKSEINYFNNQKVEAIDYLTMFKVIHTKEFMFPVCYESFEGTCVIKGLKNYFDKSAKFDSLDASVAWEGVGIKTSTQDGKTYIEFEFEKPCNKFDVITYLSNPMFSPIPMEFLNVIGYKNYGSFVNSKGLTPVDTTLSTGPYVLESWEKGKKIVLKKNETYKSNYDIYNISGIHIDIVNVDELGSLNLFLDGKIHSVKVPSSKIEQYKNDSRCKMTSGIYVYKLNINTCNQEMWENLFGENGTVFKNDKDNYYQVEKALSVKEFVLGLELSINREDMANKYNGRPTVSFLSDSYMLDSNCGISYNSSSYHANALGEDRLNNYGYNLDKARSYFKEACEKLLSSGSYKEGDTITLEIAWQTNEQVETYHKDIERYLLEAFNHTSVCDNKLKLEIVSYVGDNWSDVYYQKMMQGKYDLGFGTISGSDNSSLSYFENLKSNNSSGYTLSFGVDTSKVCDELTYDGIKWSYDALLKALRYGCVLQETKLVEEITFEMQSQKTNEDGSISILVETNKVDCKDVKIDITNILLSGWYTGNNKMSYFEESVTFELKDDEILITISKSLCDLLNNTATDEVMLDIYYTQNILGNIMDKFITIELSSFK